jgi:DNA topoisomerase VI subunit B
MDQHTLTRSAFSTSRLAEFASPQGLTTQTGHGPHEWPIVIIKELTDNGIDAAELAGVAPKIGITINGTDITVTDNGGGILPEDVTRILDFNRRVSSNEAYISPTRGRQGNALQTVLAIPFALDGTVGETVIESRGVKHIITFTIDAVHRVPQVSAKREKGIVHSGTSIMVRLPNSSGLILDAAKERIVQIVEGYAALNPHLSIALDWDGEPEVGIRATEPAWLKWLPSSPTSAHWYDVERFDSLIAAIVAQDQAKQEPDGHETLVREFIASFRGMVRSDAQKQVLDKTRSSRMTLAELFANGKNPKGVAALLKALKTTTESVKPKLLGVIGREHMANICVNAGGDEKTFGYHKVEGVTNDLPWILEVAFAYCPDDDEQQIISGCNWSPGIRNPFPTLDGLLEHQYIDALSPIVTVINLTCPRVTFADRGKSRLTLPTEIGTAVEDAVVKATTRWAKQQKAEIRDANATDRRLAALQRSRRVYENVAVFEALPAAYAKVSDNGKLSASVRQLYYALRNEVQAKTGKPLGYSYFSQTLLTEYVAEHDVSDWDIAYDDRGHLTEPHTGKVIGMGTLAVKKYLADRKPAQVVEAELYDAHVETNGPDGNYGALLYIEKEGFDTTIDKAHLRDRFDIGTLSCKGMSVTAARSLAEAICRKKGVRLFALTDFDEAGFTIKETLGHDTKRYQFEHEIDVIHIGLQWKDIDDETLWPFAEKAANSKSDDVTRSAKMKRHGATDREITFLLTQRIELNAMTSRQFINFVERKLVKHGVRKLVPGVKLIKDTYRAMVRNEFIRAAFEDAVEEAREEMESIAVPDTIIDQVEAMLKKNPKLRWDEAVAQIVKAR